MIINIPLALQALRPNAEWHMIGTEYSNIHWDDQVQTKPTEEEVNSKLEELKIEEPLRLLRVERDKRLTECDWVVAKHVEHGKMVPEKWKIYRQALRDLPNISYRPQLDKNGFLDMNSVSWPTLPE